ncbi:hypothetical protein Nmel_002514 [Mimus melanotis]
MAQMISKTLLLLQKNNFKTVACFVIHCLVRFAHIQVCRYLQRPNSNKWQACNRDLVNFLHENGALLSTLLFPL